MSTHPLAGVIAGQSWLAFELAGQQYAAPLSHVSEVIRDDAPTPVPGAAADLLGVCQLRGRIVPVLDGRRRLDLHTDEPAEAPRIVVFAVDGQRIGMRVDAVGELLRPEPASIGAAPPGRSQRYDDPVQAVLEWQGGFIALLDVVRLCRATREVADAA